MSSILSEMRKSRLLWLLVFVPVVLAGEHLAPERHTLLFLLSVLAIVPLAALLSRATELVAERTGDAVGGLLNATLGNLTELVIALTALQAGQYLLVKASIAGAIVTNTLFMLGGSFLIGGLRHHEQQFNRVTARLQSCLLFLATVGLLVPSLVAQADGRETVTQSLSLGLAVLLIIAYGLSMVFSLKTHKEAFASVRPVEAGETPWPFGGALIVLAAVTVLVALVYAPERPQLLSGSGSCDSQAPRPAAPRGLTLSARPLSRPRCGFGVTLTGPNAGRSRWTRSRMPRRRFTRRFWRAIAMLTTAASGPNGWTRSSP